MTTDQIAILIGKILSGNASKEEVKKLNIWRDLNEKNEDFFIELKQNWDFGDSVYNKLDIDKARKIVKTKLLQHYSDTRKTQSKFIQVWQKIAAILIIPLIFISIWQITINSKNQTTENRFKLISPKGQVSKCILPDGSKVWLNGGSSITYKTSPYQKKRIVELIGEGYFQVEKNKKMPFFVYSSSSTLKVVGTRFNVNAYNNKKIIIIVEEGTVGIIEKNEKKPSVFLHRSEQATIKSDGRIEKQNINNTELFTSWKDRKLIFRNESLETIAVKLEDLFDVNIYFNDTVCKKYMYRGTVEYENSIFHTLEILEMTSDITYKMTGRDIYLEMKKK